MQAVFDGHNDVRLRPWRHAGAGADPLAEFADGAADGPIEAPQARDAELTGGLCAMFVASGELSLATPDERAVCSKGLVELNFATTMLRSDGRRDARTPLVDRIGIEPVAIDPDFDGATIPEGIRDANGLQLLVNALAADGFDVEDRTRLCRENWVRVAGRARREDS